jgi:hypothetical protein
MGIFGRDGNISIIRVGTLAALLGVVLVVGGIVLFYLDRAAHQVPLDLEAYPGAVQVGVANRSDVSRSVVFEIKNATAEDVSAFYQQKMNQFYGNSEETCKRFPQAGNYPDYDRGVPDVIPYYFACLFDRSGFQITQYTRVNIQPGIKEYVGSVVVEYDQNWQR